MIVASSTVIAGQRGWQASVGVRIRDYRNFD